MPRIKPDVYYSCGTQCHNLYMDSTYRLGSHSRSNDKYITVTTGASGQNGNITVTAGNSCGTSAASTLAVTVNPGTPANPGTITGTGTVCPGASLTYSIAAVANATTYTWSVPTGWTITAGQGTTTDYSNSGSRRTKWKYYCYRR